jgi:Saxitoxin biosynthesis operon protein SxtJ
MSEQSSYHQVEMGSERSFGLVFAGLFALVGLLPALTGHGVIRWWALAVAAGFLGVALFASHWLAPINRLWFHFGQLLGKVVSPLVMGILFFVVVTPIAILARLMGKDFLGIGPEAKQRTSYWVARKCDPKHPPSMRNQF